MIWREREREREKYEVDVVPEYYLMFFPLVAAEMTVLSVPAIELTNEAAVFVLLHNGKESALGWQSRCQVETVERGRHYRLDSADIRTCADCRSRHRWCETRAPIDRRCGTIDCRHSRRFCRRWRLAWRDRQEVALRTHVVGEPQQRTPLNSLRFGEDVDAEQLGGARQLRNV
jgi:hypothetical protein